MMILVWQQKYDIDVALHMTEQNFVVFNYKVVVKKQEGTTTADVDTESNEHNRRRRRRRRHHNSQQEQRQRTVQGEMESILFTRFHKVLLRSLAPVGQIQACMREGRHFILICIRMKLTTTMTVTTI
jgi:hypothetical protein